MSVRSGILRLQPGPVDQSQPLAPLRRISSLTPQVFALLAAVVAAGATIVALSQLSSPLITGILTAAAFLHAVIAVAAMRLWKHVQYRDGDYIVSDLFQSENISFVDVCLVVEAHGRFWRMIRIHFKRPTRFGWHVSFVPARSVEISNSQVAAWRNRMKTICATCCALLTLSSARSEDFGGASHQLEYVGDPLRYTERVPTDPVARLEHRLEADETILQFDERFGYLPALLDELKIPRSSQTLVFSKTSLQRSFITPQNPRAIFFNDEVYIGFTPGAPALEVSAADPKLGGVFYRLNNEKVRKPRFVREQDCLSCHGGQRTLGVPGHFVRSIGTDLTGELDGMSEVSGIDQCTPLADRWAGWFVTGEHGAQTHRGNLIGPEAFARATKDPHYLGNLTNLRRFFEVKKHLLPTSDITALMVLEHQAKMHNYITRLNFQTQIMTNTYGHIRYLTSEVNAFLRYLLFTEETPLTAPIVGNAEYVREFTAHGPFDAKGRSLRQFDLQTRLFKYPCSFLIYSEQFDALPPVMRDHLLQRLHAILTGQDHDSQFARLAAADRQAILEILRETKPNLPDYWRR